MDSIERGTDAGASSASTATTARVKSNGDETAESAGAAAAPANGSPVRHASLTVADAIDGVIERSEQRHRQVESSLADVRQQQKATGQALEQAEQQLTKLADQQQQIEGRQSQIASTVATILENQKTSSKCYRDVMAALASIQRSQETDANALQQLTTRVEKRLTSVRNLVIAGGVVVAGLVITVIALIAG